MTREEKVLEIIAEFLRSPGMTREEVLARLAEAMEDK